jgi:hypothetical protein
MIFILSEKFMGSPCTVVSFWIFAIVAQSRIQGSSFKTPWVLKDPHLSINKNRPNHDKKQYENKELIIA